MYFQVCSNSAYPQHSGKRYGTNGPLVFIWPNDLIKLNTLPDTRINIGFLALKGSNSYINILSGPNSNLSQI